MRTNDIIKRALELAPELPNRLVLERRLQWEGYEAVRQHLASPSLRRELEKLYTASPKEAAAATGQLSWK